MSDRKTVRRRKHSVLPWILVLLIILLLAGNAFLFYSLVIDNITAEAWIEAGNAPDPNAYLVRKYDGFPASFQTDLSSLDLEHPGDYPLRITYCKQSHDVVLHVRDTVPPRVKTQAVTLKSIDPLQIDDFLVSIEDETDTTVRFVTEPDVQTPGTREVRLAVTDEGGNTTEATAELTVITDTEPPVIAGVRDEIQVYQGTAVSYREGVTVTDNLDQAPELTIVNDQVNLEVPGEYTLTYKATDEFGNSSTAETKVTVLERKDQYVDLDVIQEAIHKQAAAIVNSSMTPEQQVRALYKWIWNHCVYTSHAKFDDYRQEGYHMLQTGVGDCFSYFALSKLFFEELGIPNIDVVKEINYEGDDTHYWSLVSVDGGESYYHFDVTPRVGEKITVCLITDAYLDAYSSRNFNCFNRDKSLYPPTPDNPLS